MMRFAPSMLKSPLLVVIAASAFSQASLAAPLNLNYTAIYDGSSIINTVVNAAINVPAPTSVSTYTNSFSVDLPYLIPGSVSASNPSGSEFYDDYVFTIGGSNLSSITATVDLSNTFDISDLSVRLFSWTGTNEQNFGTVTIGSVPTIVQAWNQPVGTGEVAVINQTGLAAGTYVLQIRGNVNGTNGGTYVGQLQVTPVPVPAALPLLLSGLGLMGALARRRAAA